MLGKKQRAKPEKPKTQADLDQSLSPATGETRLVALQERVRTLHAALSGSDPHFNAWLLDRIQKHFEGFI